MSKVLNTRIRYIRLVTLFVASQAAIAILLSRRQELALLLFIPTIVVAPLLLRSGLNLYRSPARSVQTVTLFIIMLAIVSNMSYFTYEISTPFRHWTRVLFPLLLFFLSIKIFRVHEGEINVFVVVFMVTFCFSIFKTIETSAIISNQLGHLSQTNWGIAVAAASPYIFLINSKFLRSTLLSIAVAALIMSLKRTGFLSAAVLILAFFWPAVASFRLKRGFAPSKIRAILAGTAVLVGGVAYLTIIKQLAPYLVRAEARLFDSTGDGSGRFGMWLSAIDLVKDSSFHDLMFGRGFGWFHDNHIRIGIEITSLHNDFLDFLISFGVLGSLLYVLLVSRVIELAISHQGRGAHSSFAISLTLIFLIYSFFSGVFFIVFYFTPLFVGIGYLEAQKPNKQMVHTRNDGVSTQ